MIERIVVPLADEQAGGGIVTLPAGSADVIFADERTALLRLHEVPAGADWFRARELLHGEIGDDPATVRVSRRASSIEVSAFGRAPYVAGVRLFSGWRRGSDSLRYSFGFTPPFDASTLRSLLEQMSEGSELMLPGPDRGRMETYLCVRCRTSGLQTRTAHPGVQSQWVDITLEAAIGYLESAAAAADGSRPHRVGVFEIDNVPPDPEYTPERDALYRFGKI